MPNNKTGTAGTSQEGGAAGATGPTGPPGPTIVAGGDTPARLYAIEFAALMDQARQMVEDRIRSLDESIRDQLKSVPSLWKIALVVVPTSIAVGAGVFAAVVAVMAFGSDRFDGGTQFALQALSQYSDKQLAVTETQTQLKNLQGQMDAFGKQINDLANEIKQSSRAQSLGRQSDEPRQIPQP